MLRALSKKGPGFVAAGARDAAAKVKARARRRRAGAVRRGRLGRDRRTARQRAARGGLGERARRGPGAGSARLACLTLPVERVRVRGRWQCRRDRRVGL